MADRPFRVLSLDGGGMRGTYAATYLSCLADAFAKRPGAERFDVGCLFDLIVGTSTGGIIACALAAGVPLPQVVELYRKHGAAIFSRRLPRGLGMSWLMDLLRRRAALKSGAEALRSALEEQLGDMTLGGLFEKRGIALAVTAVELSQHRSWVFKTPHLATTYRRDDGYRLVDICLATSAAPVYRSMAVVDRPDGVGFNVFVDGGIWANNPVLVGLIDALAMAQAGRKIQVLCLGTCPFPAGEQVQPGEEHRGLVEWAVQGSIASLPIDAQEYAFDNMARLMAQSLSQLGRECEIYRFPRGQVPAALCPYLGLDDTRPEAINALVTQARADAEVVLSRAEQANTAESRIVKPLFEGGREAQLSGA